MSMQERQALAVQVRSALHEAITEHGTDTPEVRAKFFMQLATAALAAMANYADAETVREAATVAVEAALGVANATQREPMQ